MSRVVSIGFHQETAARYVERVTRALELIAEHAQARRVNVRYVTSTSAAR